MVGGENGSVLKERPDPDPQDCMQTCASSSAKDANIYSAAYFAIFIYSYAVFSISDRNSLGKPQKKLITKSN